VDFINLLVDLSCISGALVGKVIDVAFCVRNYYTPYPYCFWCVCNEKLEKCMSVAVGMCLLSYYPEMALVYPPILQSLNSNGFTCYIALSLRLFILNGL
jgi:hypothetical protein